MTAPFRRPAPGPIEAVRAMLLNLWVYGLGLVMGVPCLPLLLGPRAGARAAVRLWCRLVMAGYRTILGGEVEVRGLENLPAGGCLIAAKHQGMFDFVPPFDYLSDPCFVMKRELLRIPILGWFSSKLAMIVIRREDAAKALRDMLRQAEAALAAGRQVIIFPEGTRKDPGEAPDYKPGVAALYRDLKVPCCPLATNSGVYWPAHGLLKRRGRIVFEILPPIPPGLKRAAFMAELERAVEAASGRLLEEGAAADEVTRR